ncbi:MAG: hypothetical protein LBN12_00145, partial [Clostridiales Family XIII bacterium]|jgi:hypothetical protein|nr:hypothetical protein [Clostridiales Family XIII bacterium]
VQLHLDILDTFKELNDGEPMAETALTVKTVAKGTVFAGSEKMAVAAFAHGGGIDALNDQIFTQFSEYVQKPECLEYLRVMTDVLKDAAVFGGNPEEVVEYLIQGIANSYTLIYQGMAGKMASEGTMKESTAKVAKETAKSVMAIPALSRLAPEELALYPESVQALVGRFKPLVQLLAQKIAPAVAV